MKKSFKQNLYKAVGALGPQTELGKVMLEAGKDARYLYEQCADALAKNTRKKYLN